MGVPTGDGPAGEWAAAMTRPDPATITLDPYTVELLCGGTCRWCQERDKEVARLRMELADTEAGFDRSQEALAAALARISELETRRAYADVGGG